MSGHRSPSIDWSRLRRVLVVRLDNIGDVVLLGPALQSLRDSAPSARITLLASPAGTQAASLLPSTDEVWTWRALWQDASGALAFEPARELELIERMRAASFDAAFIFTSFSQTPFAAGYACYLAGIPVRAGQSSDFGGGTLSHQVAPPAPEGYQADRNLHLVRALGGRLPSSGGVRVPPVARERARRLLSEAGIEGRYVVAAPGASASARRYHLERAARAASLVAAARALPVVLVGSVNDRAALPAFEAAFAAADTCLVSLVGRTSVPELAALLEGASVALVNNSGPLHLADAMGCPTVVTYSGTDLVPQWRAAERDSLELARPVPCAPCYAFECPQPGAMHRACLDVPPEEVARAALALLDRAVARAPHAPGRSFACAS